MASATKVIVDLICDKCKSKYQITLDQYRRRTRNKTPNLCKACMKERQLEIQKNYYSSLSDEEKKKFIVKRTSWYNNLSEEDKNKHAQRTKDQIANRSKEEQIRINKKNSEGLKKHWSTISDEDKEKRIQGMHEGNKKYWKSLSKEEKHDNAIKWMLSKSDEELEELLNQYSGRMVKYNQSLSEEEKQRRAQNMQRWRGNLSNEERIELYQRTHQWYNSLSDEEKINYANSKREWYNNLSDEEKAKHAQHSIDYWANLSNIERTLRSKEAKNRWKNLSINEQISRTKTALSASGNINNLNKRFEETFNSSHLINDYYFKSEVITYNTTIHSWDYGIYEYDKNDNLVMVVDLDGAYFHADNCDYDGIHSKEEYDEKRSLSIPDDIKYFIIQELNFKKCFELMIKTLMMNYNEYVENMFKTFRSMPFPVPYYNSSELLKSFHKLELMKTDDKYHKDISLNTRIGDRLIQHFHPSIYQAKRKGCISPYDAWYNDDSLKKCIENRIIYQSYLNPNKILQGFNVSKIAQKVSVFSAGRAKLLISKYLSDCNVIFDPFSGFSGRMLGAISLGKTYIGQDISEIHVKESNDIINFLKENQKYLSTDNIDAVVNQCNILDSNGEYECMFTCSPYEDKEQWLDVLIDTRTCDDWIDECLSRFKCRKYLFVVDYTEKYIKNVVDEIMNRSHFGGNSEYVIIIER